MDDAKKKIKREAPPGGSLMDTIRRLFEWGSASMMKVDPDTDDAWSREGSCRAPCHRRKGKWKTPKTTRGPRQGQPHDSDAFVTCSDRDGPDRRRVRDFLGCRLGVARASG